MDQTRRQFSKFLVLSTATTVISPLVHLGLDKENPRSPRKFYISDTDIKIIDNYGTMERAIYRRCVRILEDPWCGPCPNPDDPFDPDWEVMGGFPDWDDYYAGSSR